ncbi:MAG: hypothetical protein AAGD05_01800 [Bacteroidota bacterium]
MACVADIDVNTTLVAYDSPCGLGAAMVVSGPDIDGPEGCSGTTYTYTFSAVDECGTRASCQQVYTITGQAIYTFCPADVTISCAEDTSPANTGMASGSGSCGLPVEANYVDQIIPGNCPQEMIIERLWTMTDVCGESSSCTVQRITVVDNEAPVMPTAPASLIVQCLQDAPTRLLLTAQDACAGPISVLPSEQIIDQECFTRFSLVRTWTFNDGCNQSSISQTIQVIDEEDINIVDQGKDQVVDCAHNAVAQTQLIKVQTPCGSPVEIETLGPVVSGTPNCPGTRYTWTYVAKDDCGRSTQTQQHYLIENDPPVFVCPPDICILDCDFSMDATQQGFDEFAAVATVTTSCNGIEPSITNDFEPNAFIPQDCADGPIAIENTVVYQIVTFTATDVCNRSTTCTALVVMVDQTAPTISGQPQNQIIECDDNVLLYYKKWIDASMHQLSARDACGAVSWTYDPLAPTMLCDGPVSTPLVQFIATDACGNSESVSAKFGIKNKFPASFTSTLEDQYIDCGSIPVFDVPEYQHGCGDTELSFVDATIPGDCGGISAIQRIWIVTDLCDGQSNQISQTIHFIGTAQAQLLQVPSNKVIACEDELVFNISWCVHSCSGFVMQYHDEEQMHCEGTRSITRTWTITDNCGTQLSCQQTIDQVDDEAPTFLSFPVDVVDGCEEIFDYGSPTVDDNCGPTALTFIDDITGSCQEGLTIHRTWQVVDACGNADRRVQTIQLFSAQSNTGNTPTFDPIFDDQLHLFPNPAVDQIRVRYRLEEASTVPTRIYDLQRQIHYSNEEELSKGQQSALLDISQYPSGSFVVLVQYAGKWLSRQFVKLEK